MDEDNLILRHNYLVSGPKNSFTIKSTTLNSKSSKTFNFTQRSTASCWNMYTGATSAFKTGSLIQTTGTTYKTSNSLTRTQALTRVSTSAYSGVSSSSYGSSGWK